MGQICTLVDQGMEQSGGIQRIAPRAFRQPCHKSGHSRPPRDRRGQFTEVGGAEDADGKAAQETFLFQSENDLGGVGMLRQLDGTGGGDDEDRVLTESVRDVVERRPGGGIRQVDVVDDDRQRLVPSEVRENDREGIHDPEPGRLAPRDRSPQRADAAKKAGQVVDDAATDCRNIRRISGTQVPLERFRPQPERRGGSERIGPSRQHQTLGVYPAEELRGQPRLADTWVTDQQHAAHPARAGLGECRLQHCELVTTRDEPRTA